MIPVYTPMRPGAASLVRLVGKHAHAARPELVHVRTGRVRLGRHRQWQRRFLHGEGPLPSGGGGGGKSSSLLTLAIETSCDDTCVAVLEKDVGASAARLLFHAKVTADSRRHGGIHPVEAAASHTAAVAGLVQRALLSLPPAGAAAEEDDVVVVVGHAAPPGKESGVSRRRRKPDFVSATRGPGMPSSLSTGLVFGKGLAVAWGVPLVGVNHMQAHALTPRLVSALERAKADGQRPAGEKGQQRQQQQQQQHTPSFPFLSLLVSGGHTMLLRSASLASHAVLSRSPDVAVGDVLDKCARVILPRDAPSAAAGAGRTEHEDGPVPSYGPLLEAFAFPRGAADFEEWYVAPARRADEIAVVAPPRRGGPGRGGGDASGHYPWALRPPLAESRAMRFDFAGINGQVQALVTKRLAAAAAAETDRGEETEGKERQKQESPSAPPPPTTPFDEQERRTLAIETMRVLFEHIASRVILALQAEKQQQQQQQQQQDGAHNNNDITERTSTLVLSGGVASNRFLRHVLRATLDARGFAHVALVAPPVPLCTDNAAMIAWAGVEMYEAGWTTALGVLPLRKWSLDPAAEGGGIMDVDGWVRRRG